MSTGAVIRRSLALLLFLAAACAPVPPAEVADARMESGAAIGTIAAPHGKSVVLVVSPADCLSCDVDLSQWLSSGRDSAVRVSIVLTRAPDEAESRAITLHRLPVAGRLGSRTFRRPIAAPCVLQFDEGRPTSSTCDPS